MRLHTFLQTLTLAFILHLQCTYGVGLQASREAKRANEKPASDSTGSKMHIDTEQLTEEEISEYEMMRVKTQREMGNKKVKKSREPINELWMTDEAYFDIQIADFHGPGEHEIQRISIACFGKLTPATCLNFMSLTKGFRRGKDKLAYKGTNVEKIIPDFMVQLGHFQARRSTGTSIYGKSFADESFDLSHNHAGWVGMANFGRDTNGSQFYILLRPARWLDGKHVLFGKVTQGMDFIQSLGEEETEGEDHPVRNITIVDCGSNRIRKPMLFTPDEFNTDGDMVAIPED